MTATIAPFFKKILKPTRKTIIIGVVIIIVILLGFLIFRSKTPSYQFVPVTQGAINETVSVTGSTTPASSVSLGFGNGGIVANTYSAVGQDVVAGQLLAKLNTSDLSAQIAQAQANLALQLAQSHNTTSNVAAVQKQQDTLVTNAYQRLLSDSLQAVPDDTYSSAQAPTITGTYTGQAGDYIIKMYPSGAPSGESFSVSGLESASGPAATNGPVPLGTHGLYIQFSPNAAYGTTQWTVSIPNTKSANYITNENNYEAAQAARDKAIADAQAAITSDAQGATVSQAQIQSAEAQVQSAEAKIQNSKIVAPINGTITQFDAKVGEFASAGTPLVSIISSGSFEVDALVSEIDIGKIAVGNKVSMTLDAFPGETFTGSVFYIDPAQTTIGGVVGYKTKVAFDTADPRMKSGLTANLVINTRSKDNVLILPQYAILQNDNGTFVEVLQNGTIKDLPVTLGLQDQEGNIEIVSGVTAGEQVLNIGLKQK